MPSLETYCRLAVVWILIWVFSICEGGQLKLDSSNKIQDMFVHINDDILEGDGSLLRNIKEYINSASMSLLKATSNMKKMKAGVQFGTVYIRIPNTWTATVNDSTWQQCNMANFFITTQRDNNNSTEPYTKQLGDCGEPANFTKFSEGFFDNKNENKTRRQGKMIMNEFLKQRYGVFSEKPVGNTLTVFDGINFIHSSCGSHIQWKLNQKPLVCSEPNKVCRYQLKFGQRHNYSVMFDTETSESVYFCNEDDRPHNKWAHSLHNIKCKRRSVSSVILQHPDFSKDKESLPFRSVEFVIIKDKKKIVISLDISSGKKDIIDHMKKELLSFISSYVQDFAFVSLENCKEGSDRMLPHVINKSNRLFLINKIELQPRNYTNISYCLTKAVEKLEGTISNDEKVFGTIIILSDRKDKGEWPRSYDETINQVVKKGIFVNMVSYGSEDDTRLSRLAKESGGQLLFADTNNHYRHLMDKISANNFCEQVTHPIKIVEEKITMQIKEKLTENKLTYLDQYVGKDVQFTIKLIQDLPGSGISLVRPSGRTISPNSTVKQLSGTTLTFDIPGTAKIGWYNIHADPSDTPISISFTIHATPEAKSFRKINPTGELSSSDIEVITDTSFIKATTDLTTCSVSDKEMVSVSLSIITPSNSEICWEMTDDGLGDDSIKDDKIFTKIVTAQDLNKVGLFRFLAKIQLSHSETKIVIKRSVELGSVKVKAISAVPIKDKVPPAKIEGVKVISVNTEKKEICFEIITTGNDSMVGNISQYEIMINSSGGEVIMSRNVRLPPRVKTEFNITGLENVTNPFEISVRGQDDDNNYGQWSLPKVFNWNYNVIALQYKDSNDASNPAMLNLFVLISTYLMITLFP